ncbi:MAG: CaiB/BaiF CoA-transferase family protein [Pseudomonadota bacterium]|nr:CaiB/BaiF CoA-transferase family protein [Pseudomonadota bacterium]
MGPLKGVKVVEFAGIGPGPFCCMLLADMGADVLRVDRAMNVGNDQYEPKYNNLLRGRKNIALDLKHPDGVEAALKLCDQADIIIEGFRPGVMERLGLGPDVVFARNKKVVYGRMTGWGQDGPIAKTPGHDINYIALTGALYAIGSKESGPVPPLNLVGDFGGGALYMAMGALAAYIEAQKSGEGQVVDTSMVEGAASLMTAVYGMLADGRYIEERETNRLDGGCHHYNVYETSDGEHVCIGSNEPQFYAEMLKTIGLDQANLPEQTDRKYWPEMTERLAAIFKTKTREEWTELMEQKEICYAPVLRPSEAIKHHHNVARNTFVEVDGFPQPGPAPKFSRTESMTPMGCAYAGEHTEEALGEWGFAATDIAALTASGAAKQR